MLLYTEKSFSCLYMILCVRCPGKRTHCVCLVVVCICAQVCLAVCMCFFVWECVLGSVCVSWYISLSVCVRVGVYACQTLLTSPIWVAEDDMSGHCRLVVLEVGGVVRKRGWGERQWCSFSHISSYWYCVSCVCVCVCVCTRMCVHLLWQPISLHPNSQNHSCPSLPS